MLYYMNSDTGKVIAREIGDEPFGNLWFEISKEEYEEALHPSAHLTKDAPDGAKAAATLSGLYNCEVCGQEKCVTPGICDDCLAPPTEFEINHWGDDDPAPLVI